jgi:hypothetical protein
MWGHEFFLGGGGEVWILIGHIEQQKFPTIPLSSFLKIPKKSLNVPPYYLHSNKILLCGNHSSSFGWV